MCHEPQALRHGGGDTYSQDVEEREGSVGGAGYALAVLLVVAGWIFDGGELEGEGEKRPLNERRADRHHDSRSHAAPAPTEDQDRRQYQERDRPCELDQDFPFRPLVRAPEREHIRPKPEDRRRHRASSSKRDQRRKKLPHGPNYRALQKRLSLTATKARQHFEMFAEQLTEPRVRISRRAGS